MIKEIKQYQAADGSCFASKAEAEAYEEMLRNPHFKKIQDRIEQLEHEILAMKAEIATLHRAPANPSWPGGPQVMFNGDDRVPLCHEVYNPTTGANNG